MYIPNSKTKLQDYNYIITSFNNIHSRLFVELVANDVKKDELLDLVIKITTMKEVVSFNLLQHVEGLIKRITQNVDIAG